MGRGGPSHRPSDSHHGALAAIAIGVLVVGGAATVTTVVVNVRDLYAIAVQERPRAGWMVTGYVLGSITTAIGLAMLDGGVEGGWPIGLTVYGLSTIGLAAGAHAQPLRPYNGGASPPEMRGQGGGERYDITGRPLSLGRLSWQF